MADKSYSVRVRGISELRRALKDLENGSQKALKDALLPIAEKIAGDVRGKVPKRDGTAAGSVKARSSTGGASIAAGGRAAPYYQWLDFGGSVGRGHIPGQRGSGSVYREWMGKNVQTPAGRYMYPTIAEQWDQTGEAALDAIEKVAKKAQFETRG